MAETQWQKGVCVFFANAELQERVAVLFSPNCWRCAYTYYTQAARGLRLAAGAPKEISAHFMFTKTDPLSTQLHVLDALDTQCSLHCDMEHPGFLCPALSEARVEVQHPFPAIGNAGGSLLAATIRGMHHNIPTNELHQHIEMHGASVLAEDLVDG